MALGGEPSQKPAQTATQSKISATNIGKACLLSALEAILLQLSTVNIAIRGTVAMKALCITLKGLIENGILCTILSTELLRPDADSTEYEPMRTAVSTANAADTATRATVGATPTE